MGIYQDVLIKSVEFTDWLLNIDNVNRIYLEGYIEDVEVIHFMKVLDT